MAIVSRGFYCLLLLWAFATVSYFVLHSDRIEKMKATTDVSEICNAYEVWLSSDGLKIRDLHNLCN